MLAKSLYHTYEFINPKTNETLAYAAKVNAKVVFVAPTKFDAVAFLSAIGAGVIFAKELRKK